MITDICTTNAPERAITVLHCGLFLYVVVVGSTSSRTPALLKIKTIMSKYIFFLKIKENM